LHQIAGYHCHTVKLLCLQIASCRPLVAVDPVNLSCGAPTVQFLNSAFLESLALLWRTLSVAVHDG